MSSIPKPIPTFPVLFFDGSTFRIIQWPEFGRKELEKLWQN